MKRLFIVMFISLVNINIFCEGIYGTWYRNSIFHMSKLIINIDMTFSIEAENNANMGSIEGKLTKIKDGYYFSYINDSIQSCLIVFIEHNNDIELGVYGDQIGAGAGVYYDGKYEKQKISHDKYIEEALIYIIGDYYDKNKIKDLLEDDINYFIECFGTIFRKNIKSGILLEGSLRGVAPWQNGIIKIEKNNIYILITDCREDIIFRYYTNDVTKSNIPDEFKHWNYFNEKMDIRKKIMK